MRHFKQHKLSPPPAPPPTPHPHTSTSPISCNPKQNSRSPKWMKLDRDFIHANFVRSNSNDIWENANTNASVEAKNVSIISLKSTPKQNKKQTNQPSPSRHYVCNCVLTRQPSRNVQNKPRNKQINLNLQGIVFVTVCTQGNHQVMCKLNLTWQQF